MNLIRSHALLHRATRDRDDRGRIVATLDDYAVVRELVADVVSEGVEATVPQTVRQTVEAVRRLGEDSDEPVMIKAVGKKLKLEGQPAYRRVQLAIDGGYLKNLEERRGRPARLDLGDPLPEDQEILPDPKALDDGGFKVLGLSEGYVPPPPSGNDPGVDF